MAYIEEILLPKLHAELVRLGGDPALITHLEELLGIGGSAPAAVVPQVIPIEPDPAPPVEVPVDVVPVVPDQVVVTVTADPGPLLEDAATWQADVAAAEANLAAAEAKPHKSTS